MLAIPVFRSRVAPVLNWCSRIFILPEDAADLSSCQEVVLLHMNAFDRLRALREEGVHTLICGALSPDVLNYGEGLGLNIIHGVAGDIVEVLHGYHEGRLDQPHLRLPGCRGRRQYRRGNACPGRNAGKCSREEPHKITTEGHQPGGGADAEMSWKSQWDPVSPSGVNMGDLMSGPGGFCVCPRCGKKVPHERGIPCAQVLCSECEQSMERE